MRLLPILLVALSLPFSASAATIHVPDDHPTIQAGVDAAVNGDTVLIALGTYSGPGNRDIDFAGKKIVVKSESGPEFTIIDCGGTVSESHRGFNFHSAEDTNAVVDGFTVKNGYGPVGPPFGLSIGGAIRCDTSSSPIIKNCILRENHARIAGGISSSHLSYPRLRNCTIRANQASYGGGVAAFDAYMTFRDCVLDSNVADSGGALAGRLILASALRTDFIGNIAQTKGGAIDVDTATLKVDSCSFEANKVISGTGGAVSLQRGGFFADLGGGSYYRSSFHASSFLHDSASYYAAIAIDTTSGVKITGCTFVGNIAVYDAGAIGAGKGIVVDSCHFEGNRAGTSPIGNGGAIFILYDTSYICNSTFVNNWAFRTGGAIKVRYEAFAMISNCSFVQNEAFMFGGGAISCSDSYGSAQVDSCLFIRNKGVTVQAASCPGTMHFSNCTFFGGTPVGEYSAHMLVTGCDVSLSRCILAYGDAGPAISCESYVQPDIQVDHSDVFGNPGGDWTGCIADQAGLDGNISADPQFCDTLNDDFELQESSPCAPTNNPDGQLIGALGAGCGCCEGTTGNVNMSGTIDGGDLALLVAYLTSPPEQKPTLPCPDEANVNAAGIVDGSDLALLVAYLTNAPEQKPALPYCP